MKRIVLIGPYPPPIGGVSIHIRRIMYMLDDIVDFDVIDESREEKPWPYNIRSLNLLRYYKIVKSADVIHIHSGKFLLRLFHILSCRILLRKYTVVTIHHDPHYGGFMYFNKFLLSLCNHSILVSENGFNRFVSKSSCYYHMLPAFLPPDLNREPDLPKEVLSWLIKKRSEGYTICVSNAGSLCLFNNQDLYGLDICIEAFKMLEDNICLLFVIADNTPNKSLLLEYKNRIEKYGLSDKIMLWEKPLSFVKLIQEAQIVIRATNTDGDALTIREALYFDKKVVASDIVRRPDGVFLFKSRDTADLVSCINNAVMNTIPKGEKVNYLNYYKEIYQLN